MHSFICRSCRKYQKCNVRAYIIAGQKDFAKSDAVSLWFGGSTSVTRNLLWNVITVKKYWICIQITSKMSSIVYCGYCSENVLTTSPVILLTAAQSDTDKQTYSDVHRAYTLWSRKYFSISLFQYSVKFCLTTFRFNAIRELQSLFGR